MSLETPPSDFNFARQAADPPFLTEPLNLRLALLAFGGCLALCGVWMLLPAVILHNTVGFPPDRASAIAADGYRVPALLAAEIGGVRGDLWAQAAFTDAKLIWPDRATNSDRANASSLESAQSNAEAALALAPINGAAWLFLAQLPAAKSNAAGARITTLLQMSYFTAPNDLTLIPLRLERAILTDALLDKDIQEFVKSDLRLLLAKRPQQQPAILAAYRGASPQNQSVFETLAAEVDPSFGQLLRPGPSK
jgi:hypothetical protein